ncbi:hypothetical protein HAX54_018526, partial [Datura stramonium]|nr:hypothetical protein [Datura stramonium]
QSGIGSQSRPPPILGHDRLIESMMKYVVDGCVIHLNLGMRFVSESIGDEHLEKKMSGSEYHAGTVHGLLKSPIGHD